MKYKTKNIVVEAVKWVGDNVSEIQEFMGDENKCRADGDRLCIEKNICTVVIAIGWYVIKEENGDIHFLSAEKFRKLFEAVR